MSLLSAFVEISAPHELIHSTITTPAIEIERETVAKLWLLKAARTVRSACGKRSYRTRRGK